MEYLLLILGIFFSLITNAIAYSCVRYFLLKADIALEERIRKKFLTDKASFDTLKTEIKSHLDKITCEVKSLQREVDRLRN